MHSFHQPSYITRNNKTKLNKRQLIRLTRYMQRNEWLIVAIREVSVSLRRHSHWPDINPIVVAIGRILMINVTNEMG